MKGRLKNKASQRPRISLCLVTLESLPMVMILVQWTIGECAVEPIYYFLMMRAHVPGPNTFPTNRYHLFFDPSFHRITEVFKDKRGSGTWGSFPKWRVVQPSRKIQMDKDNDGLQFVALGGALAAVLHLLQTSKCCRAWIGIHHVAVVERFKAVWGYMLHLKRQLWLLSRFLLCTHL